MKNLLACFLKSFPFNFFIVALLSFGKTGAVFAQNNCDIRFVNINKQPICEPCETNVKIDTIYLQTIKAKQYKTGFSLDKIINFPKNVYFNVDTLQVYQAIFDSSARIKVNSRLNLHSIDFLDEVSIMLSNEGDFRNAPLQVSSSTFSKKLSVSAITVAGLGDSLRFSFYDCQFAGPIELSLRFAGNLSFSGSRFCSSQTIKSINVESLDLSNSIFECDELVLDSVTIEKSLKFYATVLPKKITFENLLFRDWKDPIDFRYTKIPTENNGTRKFEKCTLFFEYKDLSETTHLTGREFIVPFDRFEIEFSDKVPVFQRISFLKGVLENCRQKEMHESLEGWEIELKKLQYIERFGQLGVAWNEFQEVWWNFGFDPWKIIAIWIPVSFCFFWLFGYFKIRYIVNKVYFDDELGRNFLKFDADSDKITKSQIKHEVLNLIIRNRGAYSFFLTAVIFFGFKIRHEAVNYQNGLGVFYVYLLYLWGTLHVAFTIGYLLN